MDKFTFPENADNTSTSHHQRGQWGGGVSKWPFVDGGGVADVFGEKQEVSFSLRDELDYYAPEERNSKYKDSPRAAHLRGILGGKDSYNSKSSRIKMFNEVTKTKKEKKKKLRRKYDDEVEELLSDVQDGLAAHYGLNSFRRAFLKLDLNRSGSIDVKEISKLLELLNLNSSSKAARAILRRCDTSKNKKLSFSELAFALSGDRGGSQMKSEYGAAFRQRTRTPPKTPVRGRNPNPPIPSPPPYALTCTGNSFIRHSSENESTDNSDSTEFEDKVLSQNRGNSSEKDTKSDKTPSVGPKASILLSAMSKKEFIRSRNIWNRIRTPCNPPELLAAIHMLLPKVKIDNERISTILSSTNLKCPLNFDEFCGVFICIYSSVITKVNDSYRDVSRLAPDIDCGVYVDASTAIGISTDLLGQRYISTLRHASIRFSDNEFTTNNDNTDNKQHNTATIATCVKAIRRLTRRNCKISSLYNFLNRRRLVVSSEPEKDVVPLGKKDKVNMRLTFLGFIRAVKHFSRVDENGVGDTKNAARYDKRRKIARFKKKSRSNLKNDNYTSSKSKSKVLTRIEHQRNDLLRAKKKSSLQNTHNFSKALIAAKNREHERSCIEMNDRELGSSFVDEDGRLGLKTLDDSYSMDCDRSELQRSGNVLEAVDSLLDRNTNSDGLLNAFGLPSDDVEIRMPSKDRNKKNYWTGNY